MINRETVIKLSKLSALALTDEETDMLYDDMKSIIEFASTIENDYAENDFSLENNVNAMREDEVEASYERDDILKNAPDSHDGFFKLLRRNV